MRIQRLIPTVLAGVVALLAFSAAPAIAAPEETPVTLKATAVTGNSAILHGELNPGKAGGAGEKYQFKYELSAVGCEQEATELPEPPVASLGKEKEAVEAEATNLKPNQTYSFCLVAINADEEQSIGAFLTFTTLSKAKPYVYAGTTSATEVGAFSATLNASINPEYEKATYAFEYATNEAFTGAKTIPGTNTLPPQEYFRQEIPASLSTGNALAPETTYYFRILATDGAGTTTGPVEKLTTQPAADPTVIGESVSAQNSFEPKLEARINPNYEPTSYYFEYSTSEATVLEGKGVVVKGAPPAPDLPAVFEEEPGQLAGPVGITGLQGGTIYYYRVVANDRTSEEAVKPVDGPVQSFQADGAPVIALGAAGAPTRTSAPVSGTIVPQGLATTYHFAYVPVAEYEPGAANPYARGKNTYETKLAEEDGTSILDYAAHPVALTLQELQPGTTYDYALVASNELGTVAGPNETFTTSAPTPPVVTTGGAVGVSQRSATITGAVDTRGLQTAVQFEFGATPYGGGLSSVAIVASAGTVDSIAHAFTNDLQPGTTYYYRVLAASQDGKVEGAEQSFTTPGFPAAFAPATVLPFVPYTSLAVLQAREAKEGKASTPKALTRSEKLGKALRACHRQKGARRARCEVAVRRRYRAVGGKRGRR